MKYGKLLPLLTLVLFFMASCTYKTYPSTGNLPPGQAKKLTGSKSAKPYAPGQRKKN